MLFYLNKLMMNIVEGIRNGIKMLNADSVKTYHDNERLPCCFVLLLIVQRLQKTKHDSYLDSIISEK